MRSKQILDAFSETLMQDERILSPRERELLTGILQHSKTISRSTPELQSAVAAAIGRSVGETVAQRAFALLGSNIVEQIMVCSGVSARATETVASDAADLAPPIPLSGHQSPVPPAGPASSPLGPRPPAPSPVPPGGPNSPVPPGTSKTRWQSLQAQQRVQRSPRDSGSVGVLEGSTRVQAQCVVLDEFLAPQELNELVNYTLQHEAEFQSSEVISPSGEPGVVDYNHRRSRVLMDLGRHEEILLERIRGVLPRVLDQLGVEEFFVTHVEAQITASNDGDFFGEHSDDSQETIASRRVTFVYFFHREPSQFEGGELRLYDSRREGSQQSKAGGYQNIVPRQNQIVFFPCSLLHEITPVNCPSRAFADSRFTLNGWLHN
jgi:Rps23 Pro-64 3,4-dihydroxylase Tpa1-like proline 4-hydroxylase